MKKAREGYKAYLVKIFTLAGMSDPAARAARVFDLETKIATAHTDIVASQDVHKADNWWKKADFATKAPGIDWDGFWAAAGLGGQQEFIVWHPDTTVKLAKLVESEPIEAWQDWLTFHQINQVTAVLPAKFDQASFDFFSKQLRGQQAMRPRDKRAIASVNQQPRRCGRPALREGLFPGLVQG
jgi:putative endopeptidase